MELRCGKVCTEPIYDSGTSTSQILILKNNSFWDTTNKCTLV